MRKQLYWLSDADWKRLEPLLPRGRRGAHRVDDRRVISGIMHMLRSDSPLFRGFGEIYFSVVNPGAIKGWNRHARMTLNYAVPHGRIKLVLCDERGNVQEMFVGQNPYVLVTIPPGLWTSFKGEFDEPSIVANCATLPHDPAEVERRPIDDPRIAYRWRPAPDA